MVQRRRQIKTDQPEFMPVMQAFAGLRELIKQRRPAIHSLTPEIIIREILLPSGSGNDVELNHEDDDNSAHAATDVLDDVKLENNEAQAILDDYGVKFSEVKPLLVAYLEGSVTENLAPSHATTGNDVLNAYFKLIRSINPIDAISLLEKAFREDPKLMMKLLFHRRDCRGGVGERQIFRIGATWMSVAHEPFMRDNIAAIPFYGRYDDMLIPFIGTSLEDKSLSLIAEQLKQDRAALHALEAKKSQPPAATSDERGDGDKAAAPTIDNISLAAKWVPSEGCKWDKKYRLTTKIAEALGITKGQLRQQYLTPLRKHLNIVERLMTEKQYDEINFSHVPSQAMLKLKKTFSKVCPEHYQAYLDKLKRGEAKVNVRTTMPHQIVQAYFEKARNPNSTDVDELLEEAWRTKLEECRQLGSFKRCVAVSDTSASMFGDDAIRVSLSLGLLVCRLTEGPFRNKLLTFNSDSHLIDIPDGTFLSQLQFLLDTEKFPWGGSTNVQSALDNILLHARQYKYPDDHVQYAGRVGLAPEEFPDKMFIISDMQFDSAVSDADATNFEVMRQKLQDSGYAVPTIVFWNVRAGTRDFAVKQHETGAVLISGFNVDILKSVLEGKYEDITPLAIMLKTLNDPRYDRIQVPTAAAGAK